MLEQAELFWISTVRTDGRPHVTPVVDVVVEGEAVQVTDDTVLRRVAVAFAAKWDGRWQYVARDGAFRDPKGGGSAMVFSVAPVKVFAHAKGDPFGETRHRF